MFGAGLQSLQRAEMFASDFTDFGKIVGAKCGNPISKSREKRREARVDDFEFAEQTLCGFLARICADCCVNIRTKNFGFFDRLVHRHDDRVGDFALLLRRLVRCAGADVVFFELRFEAGDI